MCLLLEAVYTTPDVIFDTLVLHIVHCCTLSLCYLGAEMINAEIQIQIQRWSSGRLTTQTPKHSHWLYDRYQQPPLDEHRSEEGKNSLQTHRTLQSIWSGLAQWSLRKIRPNCFTSGISAGFGKPSRKKSQRGGHFLYGGQHHSIYFGGIFLHYNVVFNYD